MPCCTRYHAPDRYTAFAGGGLPAGVNLSSLHWTLLGNAGLQKLSISSLGPCTDSISWVFLSGTPGKSQTGKKVFFLKEILKPPS